MKLPVKRSVLRSVKRGIIAGSGGGGGAVIPGEIYSSGFGGSGGLGTGNTSSATTPVLVGTDTDWVSIAYGFQFGLAIKADGGLYVWGEGGKGQLGLGVKADSVELPLQLGSETDWAEITTGYEHSVAVKSDGTLWAWGEGSSYRTGLNSTADVLVPTQVGTDTNWAEVSAGESHNAALKTDGTLWTFGNNGSGECGQGNNTDVQVPTQVGTDTDWARVDCGQVHTAALKANGSIWTWGNNGNGQLADGNVGVNTNTPAQVGTDTDWSGLVAGMWNTAAIKTNGTLWTCGRSDRGQLGNGTFSPDLDVLTQAGSDPDWGKIHTGFEANAYSATKIDGTLYSWGDNSNGRLANGSGSGNVNTPTLVYSGTDTVKIASGVATVGFIRGE